ncbi:histidinol dehydrogenase [Phaeovibrio sulfidiphilus]|uniref:Histidinol dehydrogenase n=1 Tax=Phaeovibrio sulfidiphilus TaxID=1220600 RepID=A0A8J6YMX4_9PROT|nr:histidinol dehydrogenase [Phaeovibrio sulfidiphilus]MBE1237708.1 histidinol dehydrogenase [Phaeovibrio sulfidiphilus]
MVLRLDTRSGDFEAAFREFLGGKREASADVGETVSAILEDVRSRGDEAVIEYTRRFDRLELTPDTLRVSAAEIDEAVSKIDRDLYDALAVAADRIGAFHGRQLPEGFCYTDNAGVRLGQRWTPVSAAGLYVPGGTASYPSSVLMNAIPARVAGVGRVVMVVPSPDGVINPLVLLAARMAGVDEVYRIGGAQAVGALAYGTQTIAPVDKIVGPGNAWVAAAKRQVFGTVGIDMIAGPSEILIVADRLNNPDWIAIDLLSQAEHDEAAQSILITDDAAFAAEVEKALEARLGLLTRGDMARRSWERHGAIILVEDLLRDAPSLVDRVAPEHLELAVAEPDALLERVHHAGAIFLGRYTPEAIGDYIAGPNHVLPTSRTARFSSGLGVLDFMKRTTIVGCSADALKCIAAPAARLAHAEGLQAHGLSIETRLDDSAR